MARSLTFTIEASRRIGVDVVEDVAGAQLLIGGVLSFRISEDDMAKIGDALRRVRDARREWADKPPLVKEPR